MKKLIALMIFISSITFANAQDSTRQRKLSPEQRTERRLQRMKKDLALTDDQASKMKELIYAQEKMRDNSQDEKISAHKNMNAKLREILTPERQTKYRQQREGRKKQMMENRNKRMKSGADENAK